jgi:hypothetical protein
MFKKLESLALFLASSPALAFEAVCVWWTATTHLLEPKTISFNYLTESTSATLPQCWLLGAVIVLRYQLARLIVRGQPSGPHDHDPARSCLKLWGLIIAVAIFDAAALLRDKFTLHGGSYAAELIR